MSADASKTESSAAIAWSRNVPLVTNIFIMKDMVAVVGGASLVLLTILLVLSGGESLDGMIMLWAGCSTIVLGVFLFTCIFIFWNRIGMYFVLDGEGAGVSIGNRERKMNTAAIVIGTLARSPGTAGAGLLAKSSESVYYEWPEIRKVIIYRRHRVIDLKAGLLQPVRLYCDKDNFSAVERMVRENARRATFVEK